MPDHEEPRGTYVLVQGTVYRRTHRHLRRFEQGWIRQSVPPTAKPGKKSRIKTWYDLGRLPVPYEVIDEARAVEIRDSSVAAWTQKLREHAAADPSVRPDQQGEQQ